MWEGSSVLQHVAHAPCVACRQASHCRLSARPAPIPRHTGQSHQRQSVTRRCPTVRASQTHLRILRGTPNIRLRQFSPLPDGLLDVAPKAASIFVLYQTSQRLQYVDQGMSYKGIEMWQSMKTFLSTHAATIYEGAKFTVSLAGIVGVVVAAYSLFESQEWNRRKTTSDLLFQYNDLVAPHRQILYRAYPEFAMRELSSGPSPRDCSAMLRATEVDNEHSLNGVKLFDVRYHLTSVLNIFESYAVAWDLHIADQPTLLEQLGPAARRFSIFFGNCIDVFTTEYRAPIWPVLPHFVRASENVPPRRTRRAL